MEAVVSIPLICAALLASLVVFLSFRHRGELGSLLGRISRFRLTAEGVDITFYKEVVLEREKRTITREEGEATLGRIHYGRILWVDDNPANNEREIKTLRERGVDVVTATSNGQAVQVATKDGDGFNLILSDIDRGPKGAKAGLELPQLLDEASVAAPIAFYVRSVDSATTEDGDPVFSAPSKLFEFIGDQLGDDRHREARRR